MQNEQVKKEHKKNPGNDGPQPDITAKILVPVLIIFQIAILSYVIWNSLTIIETKQEIRLRCGLFDPYDFMKGRYIRLNLQDVSQVQKKSMPSIWNMSTDDLRKVKGRSVYCVLKQVDDYHVIKDITFEKPGPQTLFMKLNIGYVGWEDINLKLHFDNYYLQEDFAVEADKILARSRSEEIDLRLVLAVGKGGKVVQKDFLVDNIPIIEYIEKNR